MKPKSYLVACMVTLGLVSIMVWAYRKVRTIEIEGMSYEWLTTAEFNREAFVD